MGYVGLPLALEFGKKFNTVAFDKKDSRINQLKKGIDRNKEIEKKDFLLSKKIKFTSKSSDLYVCNIFIITVPTPIKSKNTPNLKYLKDACIVAGQNIKKNSIVILESTVYPGCTEEYCAPIVEKVSKLKFNKEFFFGYSPERINPGDKKNRLKDIIKITSGSDKKTASKVDQIYNSIINAGTHKAPSIKVAESAKIVENIQRFVNISLINELAIIFEKLNINSRDVLEAAGTKWNFIKFKPGLIGGHCIAVDPYYMTHKVKKINRNSEIINTSLKLHEKLFKFICNKLIHFLNLQNRKNRKKILVLGLTFKENCGDFRNSQSVELVKYLKSKNFTVDAIDPWISYKELKKKHGISLLKNNPKNYTYDGIILAVPHRIFLKWGQNKIEKFGKKFFKIIDIKSVLKRNKNIWQF